MIEENRPLADRMRPQKLEDFVGQEHIISKGKLLRRSIEVGKINSCIFYGPPGTGKTTLANIIANKLEGNVRKLNAVSSGVGDAKKIIEEAKQNKLLFNKQTYLILDECHRWNKAQSDCVLSAIEDGSITFIGSTTENPYTNMTRAIVSRCTIFEFKPLNKDNIFKILKNALLDKNNGFGNLKINYDTDALNHIAEVSCGDVRSALNALELAVLTTQPINEQINLTLEVAENCIQKKALSLNEDMYYDILSAFCKSLRGSDAEAALYYSQRLIQAGIDPKIIARRLICHASEDVGMADSNALLISCNALYVVENVGLPECLLALTHAIIYVCEAEKSNSVVVALEKAKLLAEKFKDDNIPNNLKNHPTFDKKGKYLYPHDYGGYVKQQYLPDSLKNEIFYLPSKNGKEKNLIRKKFIDKKV